VSDKQAEAEFGDMQALLRFANGHLKESLFVLLTIADAEQARRWLRQLPVDSASDATGPPLQVVQVAFTAAGLRKLGLEDTILAGFSDEFLAGMAGDKNRSRRLGDTGANSPGNWYWGGPEAGEPHLLVMLYGEPGSQASRWQVLQDAAFEQGLAIQQELLTVAQSDKEPFGFADGISQPQVDWSGEAPTGLHQRDTYSNALAPGEVALGYRNEYGLYTARPLLDAGNQAAQCLPLDEQQSGLRDLGRNGSYLVYRQLAQDVSAFWRYLDAAADKDPERRASLAAAMVGRQMDGTPLVEANDRNDFSFDEDPAGQGCPVGAHIRRANPRTGDFPPGVTGLFTRLLRILGFNRRYPHEDLIASSRFHRILRRGRVYGESQPLTPEQAIGDDAASDDRGLSFICLGANISRQFEFVQNAWCMSSKFGGLEVDSDPLLGNRATLPDGRASDLFHIPSRNGPAHCLRQLPQFVRVRGGAYFFMPGLKALSFIARDT
jgi:Dyp-type peroxidase family